MFLEFAISIGILFRKPIKIARSSPQPIIIIKVPQPMKIAMRFQFPINIVVYEVQAIISSINLIYLNFWQHVHVVLRWCFKGPEKCPRVTWGGRIWNDVVRRGGGCSLRRIVRVTPPSLMLPTTDEHHRRRTSYV